MLASYCKSNQLKIDKVKAWVCREKFSSLKIGARVSTITSHLGTYGQGIFLILSSLSPSFFLSLSLSLALALVFCLSCFHSFGFSFVDFIYLLILEKNGTACSRYRFLSFSLLFFLFFVLSFYLFTYFREKWNRLCASTR